MKRRIWTKWKNEYELNVKTNMNGMKTRIWTKCEDEYELNEKTNMN